MKQIKCLRDDITFLSCLFWTQVFEKCNKTISGVCFNGLYILSKWLLSLVIFSTPQQSFCLIVCNCQIKNINYLKFLLLAKNSLILTDVHTQLCSINLQFCNIFFQIIDFLVILKHNLFEGDSTPYWTLIFCMVSKRIFYSL